GDVVGAGRRLLAVVRLGHDLRRRAHLLGHTVGASVEDRAAMALIDVVAAGRTDGDLATLRGELAGLVAEQPALGDAIHDEIGFRLALIGTAAGLPLGLGWTGPDAAPLIETWRGGRASTTELGSRALAELRGHGEVDQELPLDAQARAF